MWELRNLLHFALQWSIRFELFHLEVMNTYVTYHLREAKIHKEITTRKKCDVPFSSLSCTYMLCEVVETKYHSSLQFRWSYSSFSNFPIFHVPIPVIIHDTIKQTPNMSFGKGIICFTLSNSYSHQTANLFLNVWLAIKLNYVIQQNI
jgi:hypothetical protein